MRLSARALPAFESVKGERPLPPFARADARLAALVIPKRWYPQDPDQLPRSALPVVERMREIALQVIATNEPEAYKAGDYWLRFHRRPFNSVDHLHLHARQPGVPLGRRAKFPRRYSHTASHETRASLESERLERRRAHLALCFLRTIREIERVDAPQALAPMSKVSVWTTIVFFSTSLHAVDCETVLARLRSLPPDDDRAPLSERQ